MGAGQSPGRRAVFLDRDGVINRNILNPATGEYEAPLTAADFSLLPRVPEALRQLRRAGYLLFLVSNQPNYAKRKSSLADLNAIDREFRRELARMRVKFAGIYYCLHHPDGEVEGYSGPCVCRKPSPDLLLRAIRQFGMDREQSWMVGDRATDIQCGIAAGVRTILVGGSGVDNLNAAPDRIVADLAEAAEFICKCPSRLGC
jgi:D-glycero-D-manno-heptose 1,7-bisphosphate phosphatase